MQELLTEVPVIEKEILQEDTSKPEATPETRKSKLLEAFCDCE